MYTTGSLAIIDSLRIGNILLKNRMALIDYSSHTACDPNTLTIGIAEMESLGQIDFYPDKIVLPYSSLTEDKDPNFFLGGMTMKIPYRVDKSSYSFTFDTGSNINFFSKSLLLSSGQSSYNAYILIDRKPILLTELYINDSKNVIGFPLIKLFPKFSINYNTTRLDFHVDSIAVPSNYWINRGDVFELEKKLSKEDSIFYPLSKASVFYLKTIATLIGQEFLHLIPFIDLSKEKLTLQVKSEEEWDNAIPIRWEKPHLIAKINSSKNSVIIKLEEGKNNVLPQSFSTQKEIQLGNIPISLTDCTWDRELDLYMDMRGTIGIYYLLENADRIIFNFKNMSMKLIK